MFLIENNEGNMSESMYLFHTKQRSGNKVFGHSKFTWTKKGEKCHEMFKFYLVLNWYIKEGGGQKCAKSCSRSV